MQQPDDEPEQHGGAGRQTERDDTLPCALTGEIRLEPKAVTLYADVLLDQSQQIVGKRHFGAEQLGGGAGLVGGHSPEDVQPGHPHRTQQVAPQPACVAQHAPGKCHRVIGQQLHSGVDARRDAERQTALFRAALSIGAFSGDTVSRLRRFGLSLRRGLPGDGLCGLCGGLVRLDVHGDGRLFAVRRLAHGLPGRCYLLIRNIFEISVVQEIKKYGLLRTIGTTEKQIKRIVYKQAFWLSIIGISIGLILGYIVGILMLPWILNFMKGEYHNLSVNLSFNPIIFVVAGIFSAITVWVSIKKPFKIAATISPIEATRYYEKDNYHSANKNRLSFKNRITEMAWRNLRRNSKRTIFIVLSMILCIILLNSAIAIGNSVDVKKYVSSVTSFDFVVASPNTFSNVQGFRFKDDSVSNEIISDIENNIPVLNGSRIYKNTLDDLSVTYDYGSLVTEVLDEYTEDNHLIRSGMVDGRTYPVKLGVDYRPLCNIYGVEKSILPKLNFIEGETDIQQLTSYLESGNYVIEISAINPNESPEFLCPLNQEVTIYKDGLPYKTVSVIARAVVDFSLVESPGKNVGYTDVGGDCPIFYMSNEMFVELYNNPAIMSYVFDVEKEHFLPATEYINSLPTVEYASSETLAQTMNGLKQTIFIIGGLIGFLLGSIGLVNFSNIIITGIINRQREFATLESIGMTKKQINKLTVLEGLFYAFLICVMGLPLSLIVANTILPTFFNQPDLWLFTIQPTIFPLILEGIVICVVAIIVPHVSFRYFRKTSIVCKSFFFR